MYVAVPNNLELQQFLSIANVRLSVSTPEEALTFLVDTNIDQISGSTNTQVNLDTDLKLQSVTERKKGIRIKSTEGKGMSVVVMSEEFTRADMFLVLPPVHLPNLYEYFAVSVPKEISNEEDEELIYKSSFAIVASEDNTSVSMFLTQNVDFSIASDINDNGGDSIATILNEMDTLYVSHIEDLSGSRILANKPLTFVSGHECGKLPADKSYCDQMFEQIPPTSTWGLTFFTAPLSTRHSIDYFKFVASKNNTSITGVCGPPAKRVMVVNGMSAGNVFSLNVTSGSYCQFISNKPVLLMQFSVASEVDNVSNADPFMMMVPPVEQYRGEYLISTFNTSAALPEQYFINVVMESDFDTMLLLLNGNRMSLEWTEIACENNMDSICAYGVQIPLSVSSSVYTLSHEDRNAHFGVTVYSYGYRVGQGYVAGVTQRPTGCT